MTDPRCFFIGPIGTADSEARAKSDKILRHLVRPVLGPRGYETHRADELDEEGLITNQVIERLIEGELVVADLTGRNPNVFYELAVRHAARKPVVHLVERGQEIPFDVANVRAIQYLIEDPDVMEAARDELGRKVEAIEDADRPAANPVTAATDLQLLITSGEPQKEMMGEVLSAIADLRVEVRGLAGRLPGGSCVFSG